MLHSDIKSRPTYRALEPDLAAAGHLLVVETATLPPGGLASLADTFAPVAAKLHTWLVGEAQGSKAPVQRLADQISAIFVPGMPVRITFVLLDGLVVGSELVSSEVFAKHSSSAKGIAGPSARRASDCDTLRLALFVSAWLYITRSELRSPRDGTV